MSLDSGHFSVKLWTIHKRCNDCPERYPYTIRIRGCFISTECSIIYAITIDSRHGTGLET